jgi:hypothetical protein
MSDDAEVRAAHARRLMDDPLLMEAFANVRTAAIKTWEGTSVADTQSREVAWLTVKVVGRLEAEFQDIINNGLIAARRLQAPIR